jgi:two-component system, OmpR family, heavy metal sensor histidine kinase CusS
MFSIRTRLTTLYTVSAFILVTIIALFLYWDTLSILDNTNYQFLSEEVDSIRYILNKPKLDMLELKHAVITDPQGTSASMYQYYLRIIAPNKAIVIQTPGMEHIWPSTKLFKKTNKIIKGKHFQWQTIHDNNYLLAQTTTINTYNQKPYQIQAILNLTYQHNRINDRTNLVVALLVGAVCALFLGFIATKRGMRSLDIITDTAKKISMSSLNQRIDPRLIPIELKDVTFAFNSMLDRLEDAFTRLKQFSDDLAHELRTPINNLINGTEITLNNPRTIDEYQALLISNLEELQRISQFIDNILFIARADYPHFMLQKENLDLGKEIALICDFYQAIAQEKSIIIKYHGQGQAMINRIMFGRMISNIIDNAIHYTNRGGSISINIVTISADKIKISISDSGIGITKQNLNKVFERFYREEQARSFSPNGAGLGLAIVQTIVKLHQGQIIAESTLMQGTTIHITLPIH